MDRKTVVWMKERVEKAELIIEKIEHLTNIANGLTDHPESTENILNVRNMRLTTSQRSAKYRRLHKNIIDSMTLLIADEIVLLEKELAEL